MPPLPRAPRARRLPTGSDSLSIRILRPPARSLWNAPSIPMAAGAGAHAQQARVFSPLSLVPYQSVLCRVFSTRRAAHCSPQAEGARPARVFSLLSRFPYQSVLRGAYSTRKGAHCSPQAARPEVRVCSPLFLIVFWESKVVKRRFSARTYGAPYGKTCCALPYLASSHAPKRAKNSVFPKRGGRGGPHPAATPHFGDMTEGAGAIPAHRSRPLSRSTWSPLWHLGDSIPALATRGLP
jgi:hypothetical protein